MQYIRNIALLFFSTWGLLGFSQEKVQLVTKSVHQSVLADNLPLHIHAMKAGIRVIPTTTNEIEVTWKLIAKNPNKAIAEKEIGFITNLLYKTSRENILKNGFSVPKNYGKLTSQLSVEATIKVPAQTALVITSTYSTIHIENCTNPLLAQLKFGKILVVNSENTATIQANLADIFLQKHSGNANLVSEKGNIQLSGISGKYKIESKYGEVKMNNFSETKGVELTAYRSSIVCSLGSITNFRWDILNKYAAIEVPSEWKKQVVRYLENQLFELNEKSNKPLIKISNQYKIIEIR